MLKHTPASYASGAVSVVLFIVIGYVIERHQTVPLFLCYFTLFFFYILVIRGHRSLSNDELNLWIIISVLHRAVLLFSMPSLSDDVYRFVWDGRVLAAGHNPFTNVPSHYMDGVNALPGLHEDLYEKLNSKERFSS